MASSGTPADALTAKNGTSGNLMVKPKKLVIKPLKLKPQLPENFEATTWAKLRDSVDAVFTKRPVACSLEELYRVRVPVECVGWRTSLLVLWLCLFCLAVFDAGEYQTVRRSPAGITLVHLRVGCSWNFLARNSLFSEYTEIIAGSVKLQGPTCAWKEGQKCISWKSWALMVNKSRVEFWLSRSQKQAEVVILYRN